MQGNRWLYSEPGWDESWGHRACRRRDISGALDVLALKGSLEMGCACVVHPREGNTIPVDVCRMRCLWTMTGVRDENPFEVKELELDLTTVPRSMICENEEGKPGWKKFLLTRRITSSWTISRANCHQCVHGGPLLSATFKSCSSQTPPSYLCPPSKEWSWLEVRGQWT